MIMQRCSNYDTRRI